MITLTCAHQPSFGAGNAGHQKVAALAASDQAEPKLAKGEAAQSHSALAGSWAQAGEGQERLHKGSCGERAGQAGSRATRRDLLDREMAPIPPAAGELGRKAQIRGPPPTARTAVTLAGGFPLTLQKAKAAGQSIAQARRQGRGTGSFTLQAHVEESHRFSTSLAQLDTRTSALAWRNITRPIARDRSSTGGPGRQERFPPFPYPKAN